jgi:chlorite dismutase
VTTTERPAAPSPHAHGAPAAAHGDGARTPRGVQAVKFSFYRIPGETRRLPASERAALGAELESLLVDSGERMLTRVYTTAGTRGDVDFLVWQVHDDLAVITDWHAELNRSRAGAWLERPHSFLSMTMRSQYTNDLHEGAERRTRLRADGGTNEYLFVYPMAKTKAWYRLPQEERQRMMDEHIAIGHRYHGIKINTTYSYGLDDQEFVVAFEGDDPGEFLALVRELRGSDATQFTEFDTPMFTCRRVPIEGLGARLGLGEA